MIKKLTLIFVLLILLTAASALSSNYAGDYARLLVMLFSGIKFLLIAFFFMDVKKAHVFWKMAVILFATAFLVTTLVM